MNFLKLRKPGSLLVAALLISTSFAFAQKRSVDLEVICESPADTVVNGIGERLRFGMQNNGPDTLYNQDTVLYWLYVFENDSTGYVVYNGATIGTTAGFVPIGDARYYNDNYNITFPFPERKDTFTVEFCVAIGSSYIDGNGDTIHPFMYIDPNNENNFCCTQVTIIPKPSSTSVASLPAEDALQVYPNPARDVLQLQPPAARNASVLEVSIWDVNGRQVLNRRYNQHTDSNPIALDVSGLPAGVYQLRVQSDGDVKSQKLVISR